MATGDKCFGFDQNTAAWAGIAKDFQQFAVTGVKMQWLPGVFRSAEVIGLNSGITGLYFSQSTNSPNANLNTTPFAELLNNQNFVGVDYTQPFTKYISLKALSHSQNLSWERTQDYNQNVLNNLSRGATAVRLKYIGIADGETLGSMLFTWYVTFRLQA